MRRWNSVMGQEAGKSAWPKPAGGYQTTTGRRFGRRHAYVSFRPMPSKQRAVTSVDCQELEMNCVPGEPTKASKGNLSSVLQTISPVPFSNHASVHSKLRGRANHGKHERRQPSIQHGTDTICSHYKKLKSCQAASGEDERRRCAEKGAEASAWPHTESEGRGPSNTGGLSIVNIDAYEPDSSGGEEDELGTDPSRGIHKRLDSMICELGKDSDYLSGLQSYLFPKSCNELDNSVNKDPTKRSSESDQKEPIASGTFAANGEFRHSESTDPLDEPVETAACVSHVPECTSRQDMAQAEMVVRPKIRKQTSEPHLDKRKCLTDEETHRGGSKKPPKSKCGSAPPLLLTRPRPNTEFLFDFPPTPSTELSSHESRKDEMVKADADNDDFWEDLENFNEKCSPSANDEESSGCSEGEWSASWTSDSGLEKERRSSEESWETLPGLDELQSSSSSLEEVAQLNLTPGDLTPLEEGEIPWLMYSEETGSSSDDEPDAISHFVHPGLLFLDGNNNLEDDSSEDLDTEWRLLNDLDEDFAISHGLSILNPQRLTQAMEAALAHLESLAIDVEQAHPPATEQIIDCLPQITVLDDYAGQEQCCAICCSEYVSEEIATQLPCQHMFHKLCVTIWLRKSGTCPVCRHVLTTTLSEPKSFISDQDNPPSTHSAAGTR